MIPPSTAPLARNLRLTAGPSTGPWKSTTCACRLAPRSGREDPAFAGARRPACRACGTGTGKDRLVGVTPPKQEETMLKPIPSNQLHRFPPGCRTRRDKPVGNAYR